MQRGEIWFAAVPDGGDRPVLVLTRDPVADRIERVVVAALTRTRRGVVSELALTVAEDDVPADCVVSFDNLHTLAPVGVPAARHQADGVPHGAGLQGPPGGDGLLSPSTEGFVRPVRARNPPVT